MLLEKLLSFNLSSKKGLKSNISVASLILEKIPMKVAKK
jgi:hypothetical protein